MANSDIRRSYFLSGPKDLAAFYPWQSLDAVLSGADRMTVHVELGERANDLIWRIKKLGKKVGIAVNPPMQVGLLETDADVLAKGCGCRG